MVTTNANARPTYPAVGSVYGLATDPKGRLIAAGDGANAMCGAVCGPNNVAIARYRADGSLDPGFGGGDGLFILRNRNAGLKSVALSDAGRIIAAGSAKGTAFVLALSKRGRRLRGFVTRGLQNKVNGTSRATGVAIDHGGRIVIGGSIGRKRGFVARLNPNGTPDSGFGRRRGLTPISLGAQTKAYFSGGIALDRHANILTAGGVYSAGRPARFALARYGGADLP
ncbi:MAG: hypothetical protein U0R52_11095 [Solirubrobacterales bacterium]